MKIGAGSIFDLWDGNTAYVDALNGSGTLEILGNNGGTHGIVIGDANGSGTFSGVITTMNSQNTGAVLTFTKTGNGVEVLSGSNNFTGATTIAGGTLELANPTPCKTAPWHTIRPTAWLCQ